MTIAYYRNKITYYVDKNSFENDDKDIRMLDRN